MDYPDSQTYCGTCGKKLRLVVTQVQKTGLEEAGESARMVGKGLGRLALIGMKGLGKALNQAADSGKKEQKKKN